MDPPSDVPQQASCTPTANTVVDPDKSKEEETRATDDTIRITPDQEEILCDFFSNNPIFYDQRLREFKNRAKRDTLLQEACKDLSLISTAIWERSEI